MVFYMWGGLEFDLETFEQDEETYKTGEVAIFACNPVSVFCDGIVHVSVTAIDGRPHSHKVCAFGIVDEEVCFYDE